ncbi:MAG TPA: hypothetical protein VE172_24850 [Stackebrandtia sp.]|jgi:hypothetical protein|uniref:hypothetical protein n=1 Tax=Stackebrandtia sp. TaxID=2023065 RepID=UPI002D2FB7F5|nr:hypothetical protein [Stackebrandtia sp.]HZE42038.1 hypothetical protein [Stackebrandtia sp.]
MLKTRRARWITVAVVAGTAAVAGPVVVAQADIEPRTGCTDSVNADVPGGLAHWTAKCSGDEIVVQGWVKDTRIDGKCAQIKAFMDDKWHYSDKACPEDQVEHFKFTDSGRTADVYLINK